MRYMLVIAVVLSAFMTAFGAEAATPAWSETQAESILTAKLRVPCKLVRKAYRCNAAGAQKEVDSYYKQLDYCKAMSDPQRSIQCITGLMNNSRDPDLNLDRVKNGFPPTEVECVGSGAGPVKFSLFRCKVSVIDQEGANRTRKVSGRILVQPLGGKRFKWQLI